MQHITQKRRRKKKKIYCLYIQILNMTKKEKRKGFKVSESCVNTEATEEEADDSDEAGDAFKMRRILKKRTLN